MNRTQDAPHARRPRRLSRLFIVALMVAATVSVLYSLAPQTLGETARRQFLAQLQDHYRGYHVSIRRGHFHPEVGLIFEDIWIGENTGSNRFQSREVVRIERMTVVADVHPEKLLDQQNPLRTKRVVMEGVRANAWLEQDGSLSLSRLLPLPCLGPVAPRMDLRRVLVRLHDDASDSRPVTAELREVIVLNDAQPDGTIDKRISVRGSTDFANELLVRMDMKDGAVDVRSAVKGAYFSYDLLDRLPRQWARAAAQAKDLQCACDATFVMHRSAGGQLNYQLRTTVHDGRLAHPALPKPISQLRGIVTCTPRGIVIESSQGTLGDAVIRLTGGISGYQWPTEATLNLSARGLLLDDRLAAALPPSMQASWYRLQPLGRVDVDARLSHKDLAWKADASVVCKGVDVRYEKFPYPVENLVGRIEIRDGIASTDALDGRIGGNRMQCAFRLPTKPGITKAKSFVIASEGPVPIDSTLLGALSPRGGSSTALESFVRSLRPRGSVQLTSAMLATDAAGKQTRKIDLRIIDGHLRYEKFAYPMYNVSGRIQVENDLVKLNGFRATNANAGVILCDGTYRLAQKKPSNDAYAAGSSRLQTLVESELDLNFRASNVPMDESLRSSLPESSQHTWDAIAPSGVLDELIVRLGQQGAGNPISLDVTARQHDHAEVTSRSLSLRPISLPYRLDVTGGTVHYDGKQVTIESINGKHDASRLSADGLCVQDSSGRWQLLLNLHSGSRLHPDAELIAALPSQMRVAMRALQLRGPVSVRGQTRFALPDATHPEPAIQWDLALQLEGNRIADVGPVHSLRGEVSVQGMRDELGIRAEGDVRIDSMHVHDLQITAIGGPFSIDNDRLHLGNESARRRIQPSGDSQPQQASSIKGKMFGGTIELDGEVILSSGNFDVGLTVRNGQVPTLLADFGQSDAELTGTFSGRSQLQGNLSSTDFLKGNGAARVTGAKLYKLPLIVQFLALLRIKPTEDVAFTDGQIEFTIFGDTINFTDMQIWGDLIALHGGGTLNRRRELDLTFNTRVSPQNSFTRIVRPLSSQRYTLWTVDVRGPLHSPSIERRALEGVGETLERLFPAIADGDDEPQTKSTGRFSRWFR